MYTWMQDAQAEICDHGEFNTVEECIEDAKENYSVNGVIYVGECVPVTIGAVDFSSVLERIEENVYEQVGQVSEGWDISRITEERKGIYEVYEERLLRLASEYIKEIGEEPSFYKVDKIRKIAIK